MWWQAVNNGSWEQPVPGMDGAVPQVAAANHKERQTDGQTTRPCHRFLKAAGPRQVITIPTCVPPLPRCLKMYPRLVSSLTSSYFGPPNARIAGVYLHIWLSLTGSYTLSLVPVRRILYSLSGKSMGVLWLIFVVNLVQICLIWMASPLYNLLFFPTGSVCHLWTDVECVHIYQLLMKLGLQG